MAASQAQLQHQICFLSIMPNYKRNQRCLYAKAAGEKTWWEMRNVTLSLSLFHADTHLMLWLYLNDTHRGARLYVVVRCVMDADAEKHGEAWWNIHSNNDMQMRLWSPKQSQSQIRINSAQPWGIMIMDSAANLTISSQPQTIMAISDGAFIFTLLA